jgi:hypothetical protein
MRLAQWHAAIQLCMVRVEPVGAVNQISKAVIERIVVQVANLHARRARPEKGQADEPVNVELLWFGAALELTQGDAGALPPSP